VFFHWNDRFRHTRTCLSKAVRSPFRHESHQVIAVVHGIRRIELLDHDACLSHLLGHVDAIAEGIAVFFIKVDLMVFRVDDGLGLAAPAVPL